MDIWNFLARNISTSKKQYKKWFDVSSDNLSFIDGTEIDLKSLRQIVRRAKETYIESGRYLIYLSSNHHIELEGEYVPLFLTPIELSWNSRTKELGWIQVSSIFQLNQDLRLGQTELRFEEIELWLLNNLLINNEKIEGKGTSLYFDINQKAFLQKDLFFIQSNKISSKALDCLFNDEISKKKIEVEPNFLSLTHALSIDYSQAISIETATNASCYIIGPPGTGKSQTIINLALQEICRGKKVAIVSQKKAALDVISQRLHKLELQNYCLNLLQDNDLNGFYCSLEESLAQSLDYKSIEVSELFNATYYKHCIRTLEDYFTARKQLSAFDNTLLERNDHVIVSEIHPLFDVIVPNKNLMSQDPVHIINELKLVQDNLKKLDVTSSLNLGSIGSLEQPFQLISQCDIRILKKLVKGRKIPNVLKHIEKEKKELFKSRPHEQNLSQIGKEKLDYYLSYLMSDQIIAKFFNAKAREITKEIMELDSNWNQYKVWDRIESVKQALNCIEWEAKRIDIEEKERKVKLEIFKGVEEESLKYILNKLDSKLPAWQLADELWLQSRPFQTNLWLELILSIKKFLSQNPNLADWNVSQFIDLNLSQPWVMEKSNWDRLCSLNFNSENEWRAFRAGKSYRLHDFPVLKNYTRREIVQMVKFVRKHYKEFSQFQFQQGLNFWNSNRTTFLNTLLKSRKQESKFKRTRWKNSIQFLLKKWSSKKSKPSLFQAISKLDLEFLLWLKPITIASLEKFSQYISLESEIYDTLIIDEASQIELLDSIPALVRAKKVIVVGDGQQLTPSRFFKNQNFDYDQPHESILELAEVKLPATHLKYQYRAKYRELIQFSNTHFYRNKLESTQHSSKEAIQRIYLPDGIYHNRVNEKEAVEIVSQLVNLAKEHENQKSIGVIAFSVQQKEAILCKLELELSANSALRYFLQHWENHGEAFFIKSIEQVQGDERDIILISTGYAKNEQGKLYQFFGPILKHRGENRLNVLMSRAREKMIIITSLLSSQIHATSTSTSGLAMFKRLLAYIEQPLMSSQIMQKKSLNYWQYIFNPFRN